MQRLFPNSIFTSFILLCGFFGNFHCRIGVCQSLSTQSSPGSSFQQSPTAKNALRTESARLTRTKATRTKANALSVRLKVAGGRHENYVLLNNGWEEGNLSATENSVYDNYPDYFAGDRIDPTDIDLLKASLHLHGKGGGQWKLLFPINIKVWRPVPGKSKQYQQVLSGVSTTAVTLPQTIPLLIEGIRKTSNPAAFKLIAVFTSSKSRKGVSDAVSLKVYKPIGLAILEAESATTETPATENSAPKKDNPWNNWPNCVDRDWAQHEAQQLKSEPRRSPPAKGNGLPFVTVTSPANGAVLHNLTAIKGTVKPANKSSSIKRVELRLSYHSPLQTTDEEMRNKDWNGSKWFANSSDTQDSPVLTATYQNGQWAREANLPGGRHLPSGTYSMEVKAYDNFDQWGYTYSFFVIDRNPRLEVTTPARKASLVALDTIQGTVASAANSKGIREVKVRLSRYADPESGIEHEYWNGTTWVKEPSKPLTAVYQKSNDSPSQGTWHLKTSLPPEAALTEGDYQITVAASDQEGNTGCLSSEFLVWRRPKLSITSLPLERTPLTPLTTLRSIEGTVELVPHGTPVTEVKVQLQSYAAIPEYWNGTQWITLPLPDGDAAEQAIPSLSAVYTAPVAPATTGRWRIENGLPTDATLPDGRYVLIALAYNNTAVVADSGSMFLIYRGPAIHISWPKNGAVITALDAAHPVHGTARPGVTGAPIASITMNLTREGRNGYEIWNGRAWVPVSQDTKPLKAKWMPSNPLEGAGKGPGTWKRDFDWPPADQRNDISCDLTVSVEDAEGRSTGETVSFRIKKKTNTSVKKK
jgi:hypothetical protein